ncbi:MAG TPA: hypothetical protein VL985_01120 [Stellaceae bacterium]|nr:hypothetical protein [Stellaceae bacterium]
MTRSLRVIVASTGMALLAAACANSQAEAPTTADLLAQAGFVRRDVNTEERLAALRMLPPHQFVMRNSNGSVKYMYADPNVCGCIYVGGQRDYDQYRQMMTSRVKAAQIRAIVSTAAIPAGAGLVGSGR